MGIAMLIVMLFHAFDIDLGYEWLNFTRRYLFIGVDMFILLSGLGISVSMCKRKREYGEYLSARASRVLPQYFIVMIPYTIFYILYYGGSWSSLMWNSTLLSYYVRPKGMFNWYITGIMTLYAIAPAWNKVISSKKWRVPATFAGIALSILCTYQLMVDGYWYHLDIIYRVPIFIIGMLIGKYVYEDKKIGIGGFIAAALSAAFGVLLFYIGYNYTAYVPPCYAFIFLVFPILLILSIIMEHLPLGLVRRGLRQVGNSSLEIYLLNATLFIQTTLLRKLIRFGPSNRLYFLIIIIINILMGIGFNRPVALVRKRISAARERRAAARAADTTVA